MKKIIYKILYKLYCKGYKKLYFEKYSEFYDYTNEGEVFHIKFNSGNRYYCKLVNAKRYNRDLNICKFEMNNGIQELSLEEFNILCHFGW